MGCEGTGQGQHRGRQTGWAGLGHPSHGVHPRARPSLGRAVPPTDATSVSGAWGVSREVYPGNFDFLPCFPAPQPLAEFSGRAQGWGQARIRHRHWVTPTRLLRFSDSRTPPPLGKRASKCPPPWVLGRINEARSPPEQEGLRWLVLSGVALSPSGSAPDSVKEAAGRTQTQTPLAGSLGALKGVVPGHAERPPGFQRPFPAAPPTKGGWGGPVAGAEIGRQGAACGRGRRRRPAPPRLAWASVCDPNLGS